MKHICIYILLCFLILGCNFLITDIPFSIKKTNQKNSILKVNGYYYSLSFDKLSVSSIYFFYENGVLLVGSGGSINDLPNLEKEFSDGVFYKTVQDKRRNWGVFQLKNDSLIFQRLYPPVCCGEGYHPFELKNIILSDTSFKTTHSKKLGQKLEKDKNEETFYFKKFRPKPDSTNKYIE